VEHYRQMQLDHEEVTRIYLDVVGAKNTFMSGLASGEAEEESPVEISLVSLIVGSSSISGEQRVVYGGYRLR
jgi:hypothetical protein